MQERNNEVDKNIEFAQETYKSYKTNENNKIIQFLHITVLIILGAFSKCNRDDCFAVYLIISLLFMPLAYGFFFLSDFYGTTVHVYANIFAKTTENKQEITEENKVEFERYYTYFKQSRKICTICVMLTYIFLLLWLLNMFSKTLIAFDFMTCCVAIAGIILIYYGVRFVKQFPW